MNQINLLLENQDVQAIDGVTFERLNPMTGEVATRAAGPKSPTSSAQPMPPRRHFRHGRQPGQASAA